VARYMGWLRAEVAEPGQAVEGLIVAQDIGPKLQYAASAVPGLSLMAYEVSFRLADVTLAGDRTTEEEAPVEDSPTVEVSPPAEVSPTTAIEGSEFPTRRRPRPRPTG